MADLEKTIAIIFSGVDELSGPIGTIGGKLNTFSSSVEAIAAPLASAADSVIKIDAALAALAAGGLAYAFAQSTKFESAVIELKKVLGDGVGADQAIADAIELSEIYGESASSILLSMANFKQAGYDLEDAMSLTKDALDLVIAGNVEAAQASDLIIAALKGFGLEADSARRYVDILNEVSNNYATDVEQLAIGLSKLSPIANQMGFSMSESAGLLVPVIEIFRSGDEAATALKTGLLKLIDDSKPVAGALKSIGVSQYDLNGELRSGKDIFIDVATAFKTLDENQKLFVTSQLVGIEQSARMVKVFDNLNLSTEIATTALNSAGSATKEVEERLKSAEVSVDRFKVGFENLAVTVGDQFRLAAVEAIDGGTDIELALKQIVDSGTFEPIFSAINDFATKLGELLSTVAKNLPEAFEGVDFSGLLDALGSIGKSIGDMFEGADLSTPEGLRDVIQNVVDTLRSLANVTAGMVDAFKPFVQGIWGLIESFNALDTAEQKSAGEIIGLAKAVVDAGATIALAILAIGGAADDLAPVFSIVIKTISGTFDTAVVIWNGLRLAFIEIVDDLLAASQVFSKYAMFGAFSEDIEANRAVLANWKKSIESDMAEAADSAIKNLTGIETNFAGTGEAAEKAAEDVKKVPEELDKIPEKKQTDITTEVDTDSIATTKAEIENAAPENITTDVATETDKASLDKTKTDIETAVPFEKKTTGLVIPDKASIDKTKAAINEIPEEKSMALSLEGNVDIELARIKADAETAQAAFEWVGKLSIAEVEAQTEIAKAKAETVQTLFEWTAKVNIAQIEADAKQIVAAFESVASAVESTSSAAADMFSSLLGNWDKLHGGFDQLRLMNMVQQQLDMERQALEIQRDLTEAQIEYMQAKSDALKGGDGLIKIESDGLEPALEAIMWQILEKVQLRVTEEAAEYLLGLGG